MGVSEWSPSLRNSSASATTSVSSEWTMRNCSTDSDRPIQFQSHQEQREAVSREVEDNDEEKARCEWDFNLVTVVSSSTVGAVSDTLGVIEFDPSDYLLATGGIARKIRVYSLGSLLPHETCQGAEDDTTYLDHTSACDYYIYTPAKLSSLRWKPDTGSRVLGSGDYDGVVTEYDLEHQVPIFERDEHGGRRVWSVDYSHWSPALGASASDDGTAQIWDTRCGGGTCVASAQPSASRSSVCCVEFDPYGGSMIAVGCADRRAYAYDARKMSAPLLVFHGHRKTVTYVRFVKDGMIATAGTDGCLKLWDMGDARSIRTYEGHVNRRSFVGLSVWRNGGLLGCGSESNQVFVYDKRWRDPIWVCGFQPNSRPEYDNGFVSSVCWRQVGVDQSMLVAGGPDGVLQVFVGKRKSSPFGGFSGPFA
ncbi:PREDICTED: WD repeat-containing protein RUP2 [Nelumbo nucifera]|uniref:WD repeat-containing protein RUP2 n=1 Tax=Nelumbo nucifera TaxID=4432 RepID=A0A1U7ZTL8_NELNU|nr:PREDICTED: WD repeat-containing protein RUP2 [Nelumbo nucifera]